MFKRLYKILASEGGISCKGIPLGMGPQSMSRLCYQSPAGGNLLQWEPSQCGRMPLPHPHCFRLTWCSVKKSWLLYHGSETPEAFSASRIPPPSAALLWGSLERCKQQRLFSCVGNQDLTGRMVGVSRDRRHSPRAGTLHLTVCSSCYFSETVFIKKH